MNYQWTIEAGTDDNGRSVQATGRADLYREAASVLLAVCRGDSPPMRRHNTGQRDAAAKRSNRPSAEAGRSSRRLDRLEPIAGRQAAMRGARPFVRGRRAITGQHLHRPPAGKAH